MLRIGTRDVDRLRRFFAELGWTTDGKGRVTTPGGRFRLEHDEDPPRLELALCMPDALQVDEIIEAVGPADGIVMEPPQETAWGGWGASFNDPDGNTWELGSPWTVTHVDVRMSTGARIGADEGPLVALVVPRSRV